MIRRRLLRILRRLLYVVLGLFVLLVGTWFLRGPLFEDTLRSEVESALAEALGGRWSVGAIEGSWITSLEIRDLECTAPEEEQAVVLGFDRLSARWNPLGFLGDRPSEALRKLHLRGVEATLRPGPPSETPSEPFGPQDLVSILEALPRTWPDLRVTGRLRLEDFLEGPARLEIDLRRKGETLVLVARPLETPPGLAAYLPGPVTARLATGSALDLELELPTEAGSETVQLAAASTAAGALEARLEAALAGGRLEARLEDRDLELALEGIDLRALPPALRAPLTEIGLESGRLALDAHGEIGEDFVPRRARLELAGEALVHERTASLGPATLALAATLEESLLRVESLELRVAEDAVQARDLELPLDALAAGPRAGRLELRVADAETWAGLFDLSLPGRARRAPLTVEATGRVEGPGRLRLDTHLHAAAASDDEEARALDLRIGGALRLPPEDTTEGRLELEGRVRLAWIDTFREDAPLAAQAIGGELLLEGAVTDPLRAPRARIEVQGRGLRVADRPIDRLALGATWESGRATLEELVLEEEGLTLHARGAYLVETGAVADATFDLGADDLARLNALVPHLPPLAGSLSGSGRLDGRVNSELDALEARLDLSGEGLAVGDVALGTLRARLESDTRVVRVEELEVDGAVGRVAASGHYRLEDGATRLDALRVAVPDLAPLARLVGLEGRLAGALSIAASGEGRITAESLPHPPGRFTLTVDGEELAFDGHTAGTLALDGVYEDGRVRLDALRLEGPLARLEGTGQMILPRREIRIDLEGHVPDLAELAAIAPELPALAGDLELDLDGRLADWERPESFQGRARVAGRDLVLEERVLGRLDLEIEGARRRISILDLRLEGPDARLAFAGAFDLTEETIFRLEVSRFEGRVAPGAFVEDPTGLLAPRYALRLFERPDGRPHTLDLGEDGSFVGNGVALEIRATPGEEGAESAPSPARLELGPFAWRGDRLERLALDVEASGLAALAPPLSGSCTLRARFDGREGADALEARLDLEGLQLDEEKLGSLFDGPRPAALGLPLTARVELRQPDRALALQTLEVTLGDPEVEGAAWLRLAGRGALPFRFDGRSIRRVADREAADLSLEAEAPRALIESLSRFAGQPALGAESLSLDLDWRPDGLTGELVLEDLAYWPDRPLEGGRAPEDADDLLRFAGLTRLELRADSSEMRVRLDAPDDPRIAMELEVGARLPSGASFPPTGEAVSAAALEGRARIELPDLAALAGFSPAIAQLRGRVATRDLRIGGTIGDPRLSGRLEGREIFAKTRTRTPTLDDLDFDLVLDGRSLHVESLEGLLGYGKLSMDGSIELEGTPALDLRIEGSEVLLLRTHDLRVRADLKLAIAGPLDGLAVTGDTTLTEVLYTQYMELLTATAPSADPEFVLFQVREEPLANTSLDIDVRAPGTIEVRNNLARGRIALEGFHLGGTLALPRPTGAASFSGLRVKLPFSRLIVDRGVVIFSEESPFRPSLHLMARTQVRGYEMDILARGTLTEPDLQFISRPPLSRQDALLLLTTGATASGLQSEGATGAALSRAGSLLGSTLFGESDDPDEKSLAERLDVQIGREISESGTYTVEVEYELDDPWYLYAERDRFDAYNLGVIWRFRFK